MSSPLHIKRPSSVDAQVGVQTVLTDLTHSTDSAVDLSNPDTLQRLIDCLLYALGVDDSTVLAMSLGMPLGLDNREALGLWIHQETQAIQFFDSSALFNYVFKQLESLTHDSRSLA